MTGTSGLELLRDAMRPLLKHGFSIMQERQLDAFGDAYIDVQRENTVVRVARDRGEFRVQLRAAHDPLGWHLAEVVLPLIGVEPVDRVLADAELAWTTESIAAHTDGIDRLFSPEAYDASRSRMMAVEAERRKAMFGF